MKLLLLGINYSPEPVGIGPYSAGFAESMAARGHDVSVIAAQPYYPQWKAHSGHHGWQSEKQGGVRITRCPHYIPENPSGAKRLLHHSSFALSAIAPAISQAAKRPDIVLAVAPALLSVPVAWLAAKLGGAKLWIHVQDFEVEAAIATGLIDGKSALARMADTVEGRLLQSADRVSTISPQMRDRLAAKGVAPEKIVEMRNWANHLVDPAAPPLGDYRQEWGVGQRKIALYSGNIANKQGLDIVIEAARRLSHRDDLAFVICGEGPNRKRLQALASGLDHVQFHDLQPAERMGEMLSGAFVHLLPQLADALDLVLPSKLTNMLASGRPVVATAARGTGLADEVEGCGIVVPPEDPAALADAIAALADDPARADRLGEEARKRARERWARESIIDAVEREMLDMLGR
ncbi:WcaI family glycosyltransferase [Croceicoccus sp. YJ47]|uniref:WcaI family glycosyltransferase n=1 Tax=Croceicoccus sp. YJ47 TaxID=2798724 RepID=UPI0019233C5B|nr:WcaI family glycosyltransferase [Croceicoccus sp. YJ47]QQN72995.1 WcaI family glycosyltransferase [Croceicoccus sp. YJ47]